MLHLCPQVGCSGTFQLTEDDVGSTRTCSKCRATVRLTPSGLVVERAGAVPGVVQASSPPASPSAVSDAPLETFAMTSSSSDSPMNRLTIILFGFGSVIVILFLFLPLIDHLQIARRQAEISGGERRINREERARSQGGAEGKDGKGADPEKQRKDREAWETRKQELEKTIDELRTATATKQLVYTWGMLVGFVLLAIASIGFLRAPQIRSRHIVGGIVITAEILLIFVVYLARSVVPPIMP
jgi:hypothetical protein